MIAYGAAAAFLALTLAANVPLLVSALRGSTVPHPVSWPVFAAGAVVVGSQGNYGLLLVAPLHLAIALVAVVGYRRVRGRDGLVHVTELDCWCGAAALAGLAAWAVLDDPTVAAVALSSCAALAFWPMVRRAWSAPQTELAWTRHVNVLRYGLGVLAVSDVAVETVLYLAVGLVGNLALVAACSRQPAGVAAA